jgi:hypothetical protein
VAEYLFHLARGRAPWAGLDDRERPSCVQGGSRLAYKRGTCTDTTQLDLWLDKAVTAQTLKRDLRATAGTYGAVWEG